MEGGDPELNLLWWLFLHKNVMPWDAYRYTQQPGYLDLTYALASYECEKRTER